MASYTKLQSGSWGVRVDGAASAGQVVTVTKRDGSSKSERIERVLWTGADRRTGKTISICAIASGTGGGQPRRNGRRGGGCRGCGGPVVHASHHRAMAGYCGHCAFDEFDC